MWFLCPVRRHSGTLNPNLRLIGWSGHPAWSAGGSLSNSRLPPCDFNTEINVGGLTTF